jgi:hypothetical protein
MSMKTYYFQVEKHGVNSHWEDYLGKMKGLHWNFNYPVRLSGDLANNSTAAERNLHSFFHEVNWNDLLSK